MAYKIYQKLKSGMAALGLIDSTDIDTAYDHKTNGVVDRKMTQSELNAKFNLGQDKDGNQLGKTYFGGTGIYVATSPEQSGDNVGKYSISLNAADTTFIGGIKLASSTQGANGNSYSVEGDSDDKAMVVIPTATDSQIGLLSAADHQRMTLRSLGISYAPGSDTVQWVNSYGSSISLIRLSGTNVSSVLLSYGSVLQESHNLGPISTPITISSDGVVIVKIVRTTDGQDASLGIGIQL